MKNLMFINKKRKRVQLQRLVWLRGDRSFDCGVTLNLLGRNKATGTSVAAVCKYEIRR